YINPEFVLLAEQRKKIVGFLFALPDFCLKQRKLPIDTLILKTVAVLPQRDYAGLGSLLIFSSPASLLGVALIPCLWKFLAASEPA
ncbi:hypothetical protein PMG71_10200, partial [Roseofilum sp. BLCC_M154]